MIGDGTGDVQGAEVQDTDQGLEALEEAEGGVDPRVHMKEGNPDQEAEREEEHHQDLGQGHMKDGGVAPQEDQGLTVAQLQGHQDTEKRSHPQETVTVVVEVEALPQSLTIKFKNEQDFHF